jgi:hypothetical protein
MKPAIAITLIVVGGVIVVSPLAAEFALKAEHQSNLVRLLEKPGVKNVALEHNEMGAPLQFACWLTGSLMIGASIFFTVRQRVQPPAPASAATGGLYSPERITREL